jgi:DDE superfamily endonuclease
MRKRLRKKPNPDLYRFKVECLGELERLAEQGRIDLFYSDESRISMEPCIPYGWQFSDEKVGMPSSKGEGRNCFALLSRDCRCLWKMVNHNITAEFIVEQLEQLSFQILRSTVVVLDNAKIHHGQLVKNRLSVWQERGLFVFYLPPYSPHLNLAEVLWRKLKYEWLCAEDYFHSGTLFHSVWQALAAVGNSLIIRFSQFNHGLI